MATNDYPPVFVNSREPERLMKSIDMTYAGHNYRKSTSSESRLNQNQRSSLECSESTMANLLSKRDQQVLVRGSRKGTHLNDPLAFNKRAPKCVARNVIDNVPILPKLGCSDPSVVDRSQDSYPVVMHVHEQKNKALFRMNNRLMTDSLVYNTHPESAGPFVPTAGKSRRHSADRDKHKIPMLEATISKESTENPFPDSYKFTVFNIDTQYSKMQFRNEKNPDNLNQESNDKRSPALVSSSDFSDKATIARGEQPVINHVENDDEPSGFKDFVDPCWHHDDFTDGTHYSPLLAAMYDTESNYTATSFTASEPDGLPIVNNTQMHNYNVAGVDEVQFPTIPVGAEQVEDGTMTSFINWSPRPMYLAAQPMYVQPVFYPIDENHFGPKFYHPAEMVAASLKELLTAEKPVNALYYTPKTSEMPLQVTTGDIAPTYSNSTTPVYASQESYHGLEEAKSSVQETQTPPEAKKTETRRSPTKKKRGFFKRVFGCFNSKVPSTGEFVVTPKGSKDRSDLRKVRQSSSHSVQAKKQKPSKRAQKKRSASQQKDKENVGIEQELPAATSLTPSLAVINVPNDRNVILARAGKKPLLLPRKKKSAMRLRRTAKTNSPMRLVVTRGGNRPEMKNSETEIPSSQLTTATSVYAVQEPARVKGLGLSPVSSTQQMRRKTTVVKPQKPKSGHGLCVGKRRSNDATQTVGDPPYGSHDQHGYNHMTIRK